MTNQEKAAKMYKSTMLGSVRAFLTQLGPWPETEEEWAIAYDLYIEAKGEALQRATG